MFHGSDDERFPILLLIHPRLFIRGVSRIACDLGGSTRKINQCEVAQLYTYYEMKLYDHQMEPPCL